MSKITPAPLVKPFAAVFSGRPEGLDLGLKALERLMGGAADIVSDEFTVTETRYYEKEMGPGLLKIYAAWPELMPPEKLVEIKLGAMELEEALAAPDGRRQVNLDPGYIFSGGLVLSTGKFRGHRLPLGGGLWGELTLHYHQGQFQPFPWTYQDYKSPEVQKWLIQMRKACMARLKGMG